jgi:hypothetical protein
MEVGKRFPLLGYVDTAAFLDETTFRYRYGRGEPRGWSAATHAPVWAQVLLHAGGRDVRALQVLLRVVHHGSRLRGRWEVACEILLAAVW